MQKSALVPSHYSEPAALPLGHTEGGKFPPVGSTDYSSPLTKIPPLLRAEAGVAPVASVASRYRESGRNSPVKLPGTAENLSIVERAYANQLNPGVAVAPTFFGSGEVVTNRRLADPVLPLFPAAKQLGRQSPIKENANVFGNSDGRKSPHKTVDTGDRNTLMAEAEIAGRRSPFKVSTTFDHTYNVMKTKDFVNSEGRRSPVKVRNC